MKTNIHFYHISLISF